MVARGRKKRLGGKSESTKKRMGKKSRRKKGKKRAGGQTEDWKEERNT